MPPESSPRGEPGHVVLDLCWTWLCPLCQHRNYHHGARKIEREMEPQEIKAAMDHLGVDSPEGLMLIPTSCHCVKCETTFVVQTGDDT